MSSGSKASDRRSRYTEEAIKNAFLEAINQKEYSKVTVSDVCARADVHRTTFYLHYKCIDDVFRAVIDDIALQLTESFEQFPGCVGCDGSERVPLCEFVRKNELYRPIFCDPVLCDYCIGRLSGRGRDAFVEYVGTNLGISSIQAESIAWFQLHGCLAATVRCLGLSDEEWASVKDAIDGVIRRGIRDTSSTSITIV